MRSFGRVRLALALAVVGTGLLAVVVGLTVPARPVDDRVGSPAADPATASPLPDMSWGRPVPAVPTRLRLSAIDVDAPVVPVALLPDGGLNIPEDPRTLGWWQSGAGPEDPAGTVVVDGHVDTARDGPGAMFDLFRTRPGQEVALDTGAGSRRYVVTAVRRYPKTALPADLFTPAGPPHLVLITCGGPFTASTRQYADNVVAYADPR